MRAVSPPQSFHSVGCALAPPTRPMPASANTHALRFFMAIPGTLLFLADRAFVGRDAPIFCRPWAREDRIRQSSTLLHDPAWAGQPPRRWTCTPADAVMGFSQHPGDDLEAISSGPDRGCDDPGCAGRVPDQHPSVPRRCQGRRGQPLHHHRHFPAADPDDHRAPGVLDPGGGHRPYGGFRRHRPGGDQDPGLVHAGLGDVR